MHCSDLKISARLCPTFFYSKREYFKNSFFSANNFAILKLNFDEILSEIRACFQKMENKMWNCRIRCQTLLNSLKFFRNRANYSLLLVLKYSIHIFNSLFRHHPRAGADYGRRLQVDVATAVPLSTIFRAGQ